MVVLDQDGVIQPEAVVHSAAAAHGVFLQRAQARRGLAGVDDDGARPLHRLHIGARKSGDPRQPPEQVERRAFCGQKRAGVGVHAGEHGAGLSVSAVRNGDLDPSG